MSTEDTHEKTLLQSPATPYVFPFALFLLLTAIDGTISGYEWLLYPVKTVLCASACIWSWKKISPEGSWGRIFATFTGLFVFAFWVGFEGSYPLLSGDTVYDPVFNLGRQWAAAWMVVRIMGAALVVPVLEEFFWRGFFLRWVVNADFEKVKPGTFTWQSFVLTSLLFGVEHHRWLVGILAGICYNVLYYRTRSLKACILAHGITNFVLGLYVINTGEWKFW